MYSAPIIGQFLANLDAFGALARWHLDWQLYDGQKIIEVIDSLYVINKHDTMTQISVITFLYTPTHARL